MSKERLDMYCRILICNIVDFQSYIANYRCKDDPDTFKIEQDYLNNLDHLLEKVTFLLDNSPWTDSYNDPEVISLEESIFFHRIFSSIRNFFIRKNSSA